MVTSKFTLWKKEDISFPKYVTINDEKVSINSNFRTILKILKMYSDPEVDEFKKIKFILKWFYPDPIDNYDEALKQMMAFIVPPDDAPDPTKRTGTQKAPTYCFEFDAEEIYTSFLQDYNLDLVSTEYLHWYRFLIMFGNLSKDTSLMRKIELRTMDISDFKGKARAKVQKAQKSVQIPHKLTSEESELVQNMMTKLMQ